MAITRKLKDARANLEHRLICGQALRHEYDNHDLSNEETVMEQEVYVIVTDYGCTIRVYEKREDAEQDGKTIGAIVCVTTVRKGYQEK